jgi:hypothetical protein
MKLCCQIRKKHSSASWVELLIELKTKKNSFDDEAELYQTGPKFP